MVCLKILLSVVNHYYSYEVEISIMSGSNSLLIVPTDAA